jgi:hypothetical protein
MLGYVYLLPLIPASATSWDCCDVESAVAAGDALMHQCSLGTLSVAGIDYEWSKLSAASQELANTPVSESD